MAVILGIQEHSHNEEEEEIEALLIGIGHSIEDCVFQDNFDRHDLKKWMI